MVQTLFSGQIDGFMANALQTLPLAFSQLSLKEGLSSGLFGTPSLTGLGLQTFRELLQLVCLQNFFSYGTYCWIFSCSRRLRIDTYGGSPLMDSIQLSQHTKDSFWVLLFLDLGKGFGNHGRRPNVASLYGSSRTISAGRLIA
jgi:hypothetical protein